MATRCTSRQADGTTLRAWAGAALALGVMVLSVLPASAQRPFRVYDPFYQQESARRAFFDGFAVTGEVSYRSAGQLTSGGVANGQADPLGIALRVDYQLAKQLDLSAIIDASATGGGRTLSLSWVVLKYYDCVENADCLAVRLAVDPLSESRLGFPQLDLALITTTFITPRVSSNFAAGMRRVRIGYTQFTPRADVDVSVDDALAPSPGFTYTRALGTEVHAMTNTNFHFDPAGSNLYLSFLGHVGQYEIIESKLRAGQEPGEEPAASSGKADVDEDAPSTTKYRGAVVWARLGVQYNRPAFQVTPFLGIPLGEWRPQSSDWQKAAPQFGVRLMLR